jgi:hypothetical protein
MKNTKIITKLALMTALMGGVATTTSLMSTNINTVKASAAAPTATDKDYAKLQRLSKLPGMHKMKRKWYASWTLGNNTHGFINMKTLKPYNDNTNPGREWASITAAGTIKGTPYVLINDLNGVKSYSPASGFVLPYGMKYKAGSQPVEAYRGAIANSENGYDKYQDDYGQILVKSNMIYKDNADGHFKLTMKKYGKDFGKNQGFFIGKTAIHMDDNEDYYPVYTYTPYDVLPVYYIKTSDIDHFEPATVTYNKIGTISKSHKFTPDVKSLQW